MRKLKALKPKYLSSRQKNPLSLKKLLYRTAMTIMIGFMALTNMTVPTHAEMVTIAEETDFNDTQHAFEMAGPVQDGGTRISFYTGGYTALKANGEYVFCIEPWKEVAPGTIVSESTLENKLSDRTLRKTLSAIGYYGYFTTAKTRADYITTQMMIWEARGWTIVQKPSYYDAKKAAIEEKIARSARTLSFSGATETVKVNETVSFTDTNGVLSDYMKAEGYTNQNTNYDVNGVTLKWSGNTLYLTPTVNVSDTFTLSIWNVAENYTGTPIVYYNGNVQLTSPLNKIDDPARSILTLNIEKYGKVSITKLDETSGKLVKQAGIVYDIYKKSDNSYVSTVTSDETGVAESGLLEFGDYYYIEQKAPNNYLVNSNPQYFTIDKSFTNDEFEESNISDRPVVAQSTLTKSDKETGATAQGDASLDGAVYGFYAGEDIYDPSNDGTRIYQKDQLISTHTIKNGQATATTDYLGLYYWKEVQASDGYLLDLEKHYVNLIYEDQNTSVIVKDTVSLELVKKQAFQIIKVSSPGTSGELPALGGAGFTVKLESDVETIGWDAAKTYDVLTTDSQGMATSVELPVGKYRVRETTVPKDHEPIEDFFVEITEDNRTPQYYRYFLNEILQTKLAIVKKDAETGNTVPISGMKFRLKALTKTADFKAGEYVGYWSFFPLPHYVDSWETTEEGAVFLEMTLKAGTYQLEEVNASAPYLLNHEPLIFSITGGWHQSLGPDQETLITTVNFEDEPVKGQVKIDKEAEIFKGYTSEMTEYGELFTPVYETGLLPNVEFTIKAETDIIGAEGTVWYKAGETVETLKTDGENITVSSILPVGSEGHNLYSLQEVSTEEGYAIDDTIRYFRFDYVDQNTPVVPATWLDEYGNVLDTNEVLSIENERQTAVVLTKKEMEEAETNDMSEAYKNVVFGLFTDEVEGLETDSLVGIGAVNEEQKVELTMSQEGSYYVQELSSDDRYRLDTTKYPVQFAYNGDQVQIIKVNDGKPIVNYLKRGTIEIIKYTEDDIYYSETEQKAIENMGEDMNEFMRNDLLKDDRNYIAFVEFELATDKYFTNVIRTGETDVTGRLVFEDLELGTYYVREKESSDFYEINDEIFEITLERHGQFETVNVKNDLIKSYVDVKKVDYYDHNKALPYAGFTMYSDEECTKEIETIKADKTGIVRFDDIKFGSTVYIKETSAPIGYELSDEVVKVTIDEAWVSGENETRVIIYPDQPLPIETVVTGDTSNLIMYMGLLGISIASIFVLLKKKKSETEETK